MIRYKWDYKQQTVRAVECENPTYPNEDAEGDTIFTNTHYATEAEAWGWALENADAGIDIHAGMVEELEGQMARHKDKITSFVKQKRKAQRRLEELNNE